MLMNYNNPEFEIGDEWIRFDFSNSKQFEWTVPAWCLIGGEEIIGPNWARILVGMVEREISNDNPSLIPLYKQSLIANRKERPFFLDEKIEGLNCSQLSNGFWLNVNYSIPRLMEQIKAFCLLCGYTKENVIIYGVSRGKISMKSAESVLEKASANHVDNIVIEEYFARAGLKGATVREMVNALQPCAAVSTMRNMIDRSIRLIAMPGGRFVHVDSFVDLDEAEDEMYRILQTHFTQFGGYSNSKLLFGSASHNMSMFLNDNDCENIDYVYSLAQYFFGKKRSEKAFIFSNPHIFKTQPDYPMTLKGLMINLARLNGGVLNAGDAKNYLQKTLLSYGSLGQLLQISSSSTFLYYSDNCYLLTESIAIDEVWKKTVHNRLDNLLRQANVAYVIPRDITEAWLHTLPELPHGLPWTLLLLQEVLKNFPEIGFQPINSELDQARNTIAAAVVPEGSPIQSFPDVVTLYMQERYSLPKRMAREELRKELRKAGMLEGNELIYALPKALDDFRFSWTDENKLVLVRGN